MYVAKFFCKQQSKFSSITYYVNPLAAHWRASSAKVTFPIITLGLFTFYPLFELHLCTVTFGLVYSRAVSNQERVIVARVRYYISTFPAYIPHPLPVLTSPYIIVYGWSLIGWHLFILRTTHQISSLCITLNVILSSQYHVQWK